MPIGMSRSVSGKSAPRPALRSRLAMSAERMPETIGPMIFSSVQIAATPIVPAPTMRAFCLKAALTSVSRSPPICAAKATSWVQCGTMNTQVISMPTTIARPTATPTRWPTPISAIDRLAEMAEPPVPTLKTLPRRVGQQPGLGDDEISGRDEGRAADQHQAAAVFLRSADAARRPSALRRRRRLRDRAGRCPSPAPAAAAPNTSRRGCRRCR